MSSSQVCSNTKKKTFSEKGISLPVICGTSFVFFVLYKYTQNTDFCFCEQSPPFCSHVKKTRDEECKQISVTHFEVIK